MLYTGYMHSGPAAVRYPRGSGVGAQTEQAMQLLPIGKGMVLRRSETTHRSVAILAFGASVHEALRVAC